MTRSKETFSDFLDAVNKGYNADFLAELPNVDEFPDRVFSKGILEPALLEAFAADGVSPIMESVCKRMIAICMIQNSREQSRELDVDAAWRLVAGSISCISQQYTISSIGSQGFLSIPLFKSDKVKSEFEFIRLHIWADSLNQHMDVETCELFSIHTHSFYARSWTITGKVVNNKYHVVPDVLGNGYSLFDVKYNSSLNNVNQHSSTAINTGRNVKVTQIGGEIHQKGSTYDILAGDFHKSGHQNNEGVSATFFSFTAKDGLVEASYVVGPSELSTSQINRKMSIDPIKLIEKIHEQIKSKS